MWSFLSVLEKDRFSYISLIEGMTTSVDKRFGNMNKVLELLTLASKYIYRGVTYGCLITTFQSKI